MFIFAQESGVDTFCDQTDDGSGLIPLIDPEPGMSCDPDWGMIALSTGYFGLYALPVVFLAIRGVRWLNRFSERGDRRRLERAKRSRTG